MAGMITLSFPEDDIALLTLNDVSKGANVLSRSVLDELATHLDALDARRDLAGLIVQSGKPGSFIAGADLREFAASFEVPKQTVIDFSRHGQQLFGRFSRASYVTVAAVDGLCLGGGAELAIWCDRRVMTDSPKTQFGFPEVKIGLFPGWGGTVRMSRITGLGNAVDVITSGEPLDAQSARLMGLASDVAPREHLLASAIAMVRAERANGTYVQDRLRWSQPIHMSETEFGFLGATASSYIQQQTGGKYPAPLAALEVLLGGSTIDAEAALVMEAEKFAEIFGTPVNRALVNVFFLTDRNKKDKGVSKPGIEPKQVQSVSVIGAGIMGAGIAAANLKRELAVTLGDANAEALGRGVTGVLEEVSFNKQTKQPDPERAIRFASLLNATASDAELASADLVIEAVVENADVKRQLFARLEPQLRDDAILASNTSTIPISELARDLKHPERFCGIHFFNPVRKMPLVEVIRGQRTSDATIATAVAHAKSIGKSPIVTNDGPGFLVNRLLFPYMNEAIELLCDGAELRHIEKAAKEFGMPMGPFTLYDVVGIDTCVYAGRVLTDAFPDRFPPSPLLPAMLKRGRLGQKSDVGFFRYADKKGRGEPDPTLAEVIEPYMRSGPKLNPQQLTERLFLPMLLEATWALSAGIVRDPRDVDLGLIFGLGFPPFKGGLLYWADTLGAARILEMLKPYESLGPRFQPTPLLLETAESGKKFYDVAGRKES
jgi:3-hydroxyacyl-CoA dehydrogenase/enoyl-CoA hydratase/3-hydroxybutyryl-CoA epimerase/3-hydroxyacyl-CoA dehydrogenase/enoyl-CoA hydratase/3-hydroxybutyryl-CoA epimerase/enoyl-CoA isomerase